MLRSKNYQNWPPFHGVIQKIKVTRIFETRCILRELILTVFVPVVDEAHFALFFVFLCTQWSESSKDAALSSWA